MRIKYIALISVLATFLFCCSNNPSNNAPSKKLYHGSWRQEVDYEVIEKGKFKTGTHVRTIELMEDGKYLYQGVGLTIAASYKVNGDYIRLVAVKEKS